MPRFRNRHKSWLTAKYGSSGNEQVFAYMRLGMFTLFKDENLAHPLISIALSSTTLDDQGGSVVLTAPLPPSIAEIAANKKKAKAAAAKGGKAAAEEGEEG